LIKLKSNLKRMEAITRLPHKPKARPILFERPEIRLSC